MGTAAAEALLVVAAALITSTTQDNSRHVPCQGTASQVTSDNVHMTAATSSRLSLASNSIWLEPDMGCILQPLL